MREHRDSIPEGVGAVRGPRQDTTAVRPAQRRHITFGRWKAKVIMPKRRPTLPIAHADPDDVSTIAFTDEQWQAIEQAYGRQLNPDVRQQITTITTDYLKDCGFKRAAAPKEMALKRIERVRRAAGDLEEVMLDREASSVSDELSRQQRQSAHSYAERLIRRHLANSASSDERSRQQDELSRQQNDAHSDADYLIRRHFDEQSLARDKLHHFRDALKSLVVACDCALNDLSAAEYCDDEPWNWWIQGLTRIAREHGLPAGVSTELDRNGRPLPFVRLVQELDRYLPADARQRRSPAALAMAISRARNT
jgi:hypothetical protein